MRSFTPKKHRERPSPTPLDPARLNSLALAYVARFATSAAKLETYLNRKLNGPGGSGWQRQIDDGNDETDDSPVGEQPDMRAEVKELVARFVAAGYVDDRAFASARSGGLQRRGFGRRHIAQALGQAGIAAEIVATALPGEQAGREAALALARKRRLGPFGPALLERGPREKQVAVLLRAGHPLDSARNLVNAASVEAAEAWAHPDEEEDE